MSFAPSSEVRSKKQDLTPILHDPNPSDFRHHGFTVLGGGDGVGGGVGAVLCVGLVYGRGIHQAARRCDGDGLDSRALRFLIQDLVDDRGHAVGVDGLRQLIRTAHQRRLHAGLVGGGDFCITHLGDPSDRFVLVQLGCVIAVPLEAIAQFLIEQLPKAPFRVAGQFQAAEGVAKGKT